MNNQGRRNGNHRNLRPPSRNTERNMKISKEEEDVPLFVLVGRDATRNAADLTAQTVRLLVENTDPKAKRQARRLIKKALLEAQNAVSTLSIVLQWNPSARHKKARQSTKKQ